MPEEGFGGWVKQVMGIKEGTCGEHRVMDGSAESLYRTPETHIMLDVNELELNKNFKKCSSY